jgi:hypothetical protein
MGPTTGTVTPREGRRRDRKLFHRQPPRIAKALTFQPLYRDS